jgi:hypothetical protein
MRAFSTVELLVVVALIALMISLTLYFRWDDTEKKLDDARIRDQATQNLWLQRIDEPNPPRGIWEWEDENGKTWIMFREGSVVHNVGDIDLP